MKIFITGGGGQLAYDLQHVLKNHELFAPTRSQVSITDFNVAANAIEAFKPDVVINAAAYTAVDRAEQENMLAHAVNAMGAKNIAMICEKIKCPLIHLSTDYVFDGLSKKPYLETDHVSPINVYGETKLLGEKWVQQYCEKAVILRVSGVFGFQGNNFVKTILRLAREKETLQIVNDQIISPTSARSIAHAILKTIENPFDGLYHFCSQQSLSWYDFTKIIIRSAERYQSFKVKEIHPITTAEYPTPAKRPLYSVLNCEKIFNTGQIEQPNLMMELENVIYSLSNA